MGYVRHRKHAHQRHSIPGNFLGFSRIFARSNRRGSNTLLAGLLLLIMPGLAAAQGSAVRPLITQGIDETKVTTIHGNTHPLARSEFDRGAAPSSLAMDHMLLVLKRSPEQEAALETLLAQQQDKSSANYHNWLTPQQFGQQFGPADADIQAVTNWLQTHGFQNVNVSNGRTTIDFSGTAGQVQAAFHITIHKYVLTSGEEHWANASDPQIPSALNAAVAGVNSLNNFPRKPLHHTGGVVRRSAATGKLTRVSPAFTFADNCNGTNTNCYAVGPGDFATIYNVPSTINGSVAGTGQTIAIVSDSDIYPSDVNQFRSLFSLPAINFHQIETGTDPGVVFNNGNGDEVEAVIDVEWSGAIAPGATIDLVVSPTTNTTFGGDTSAAYVINGSITPLPQILSNSYGTCELELGTTGNQFYNTEWQQAAAEGITVVVASADSGSAGCDFYSYSNNNPVQPAEYGLQVNGVASTPYNVAVGGTDFNDLTNPTTYWTNVPGTVNSAMGYIPETTYNDTCTNAILYSSTVYGFGLFANAELACNNATVQADAFVIVGGGGGGASNCTTPNGPGPSNCSGGYAKPSWQIGTGVPADGLRDLPDVSLFAGDGTIQDFYVICESDYAGLISNIPPPPCSLASPYLDLVGEGGTSIAAQAFAGIVALIDQKQGSRQGNINPLLYTLAGESLASSIFHDVTTGTNAMPCTSLYFATGCTINLSGDTIGVLKGYNAGTGYDQATGLGSVNVTNLVNNSGPTATLVSIAVTPTNPSIAKGLTQQFTATGTYTDASTQDLTGTATWSSSVPALATISTTGGLATALTTGSTTIKAVSGSVTSNSATLTVTAAAATLVSIAVTPTNPSIAKGITQQFTATGTYTDASTKDLTGTATWSSSVPAVATISTTGLATALTTGSTTIKAVSGSVTSNSATLTVTAVTPSITLAPTTNTATINIITPGHSGTQVITVTGSNITSADNVTLTCTVAPTSLSNPPTCSFNTNPIALSATTTSGQSTLTVNTTAASSLFKPASGPQGPNWLLMGEVAALMGCLFLLGIVPQRRRGMVTLAMLLFAVMAVGAGCGSSGASAPKAPISSSASPSPGGGGNPGTTVSAYTVTVTATPATGAVQTTTIAVNVQ
jgi:subtilase family serine protease